MKTGPVVNCSMPLRGDFYSRTGSELHRIHFGGVTRV
jgi:hypothetical protein